MTHWRTVACCLLLLSPSVRAVQPRLDRRAIEEAIFLAQSNLDAERLRFHAPYRIGVTSPPIDWIDVITPFHRVELAAETSDRAGNRFGQREALQVLGTAVDQLDFLIEMTFHPFNTFIGVPNYTVTLVGRTGPRVAPRRVERVPRFGPRVEAAAPTYPGTAGTARRGTGQPVVGGTLIAVFDLAGLDPEGRYEIVVTDGEMELTRAAVDLTQLR
jgi:hypothetical protein